MDYSVLEKSTLFQGVPAKDLRVYLEETPHHIQCYDKEETIFHLMDPASRIGIILEGRAEAQKAFPNGSQVNVSVRCPGEMIGPAAVFSKSQRYPCDIIALEPTTLMVFQKADLLSLMQKNYRNLHAAAKTGAFILQRNCAKSRLLDTDADQANREDYSEYPGLHIQMGYDLECVTAITPQGNEKTGRRRNHPVYRQDHRSPAAG